MWGKRCYFAGSVLAGAGVRVNVWVMVALEVRVDVGQGVRDGPLSTGSKGTVAVELGRRITPSESGEGFGRHYFEAMQRDPDVVLAHAGVVKLLGPRK